MEQFENAEVTFVSFDTMDIITTSGNGNDLSDLEQEL